MKSATFTEQVKNMSVNQLIWKGQEIDRQIKASKEQLDAIKTALNAEIASNPSIAMWKDTPKGKTATVTTENGTATYKLSEVAASGKFDTESFKRDYPDLFAEYYTAGNGTTKRGSF